MRILICGKFASHRPTPVRTKKKRKKSYMAWYWIKTDMTILSSPVILLSVSGIFNLSSLACFFVKMNRVKRTFFTLIKYDIFYLVEEPLLFFYVCRKIVEDVPRGVHINFLKAERSLHRWAKEDLQRIHVAEEQAVEEGGGVEMHVLEDAGHWVCCIFT